MIVNEIKLRNYRNYNNACFKLHPSMNIIIGKNGSGKTNILESLSVIANTKSFRCSNDKALIENGFEYAKIEVLADEDILKIIINEQGKSLWINNNLIKKTSDFIGKLNVVLFEPRDLELFKASPKYRRNVFDLEIGKVDTEYMHSIITYAKLLSNRNHLLKQDLVDELYLDLIDEKMIEPIKTIMNKRNHFINIINTRINFYFYNISHNKNKIKVVYEPSFRKSNIKENIFEQRSKDKLFTYTTKGPHKDDFTFLFDDKPINEYASQGQKRLVMVAFKLALVDYIKITSHKIPILLLDDILSELDITNRTSLLEMLPSDIQTILTTTDISGLSLRNDYKLFKLKG